jgi:acyl transferase domain-containing protein
MSHINLKEIVGQLTENQQQYLYQKAIQQRVEQQEKNSEAKDFAWADIAIIGLSGRYPQSDNHYEFWRKIQARTNFVEEVPISRWNHQDYYDPNNSKFFVPNKTRCRYGSFLKNYDQFDASFFDIRPDEVYFMSPQERIALETTWSCIEDAGYTPEQINQETGVFTGVTNNEYQKLIPVPTYLFTLNARIAYFFNFQGPTITIDAGCASSLGAIQLACESLLDKKCTTAVVVGANIIQHPDHYVGASNMLSPTAEPASTPFGKDDGWIPAEGVVSILLKPLKQAIQDRDHIYATIKSTHVIQSGKTAWFMAFDPKKQAKLIQENFEKSGIHPETISYVEAAANGSVLGDTIEMEGLTAAFRKFTNKKQFCPIGTVKSNIGHSEGVSTLEQITKVLLQFKTQTLYPLIRMKEKNPNMRIDNSPFYLLTTIQTWERPVLQINGKQYAIPRRAAISSFCMGGNMGHLILEEYAVRQKESQNLSAYFIPFSAKSKAQLRQIILSYVEFFTEYSSFSAFLKEDSSLLNIMFTLCVGRVSFAERVVFIAKDLTDLLTQFNQYLQQENSSSIIIRVEDKVVSSSENAQHLIEHYWQQQAWHSLAKIWVQGIDIPWQSFFEPYAVQRVPLPTYSFEKQSFPLPKPRLLHELQDL